MLEFDTLRLQENVTLAVSWENFHLALICCIFTFFRIAPWFATLQVLFNGIKILLPVDLKLSLGVGSSLKIFLNCVWRERLKKKKSRSETLGVGHLLPFHKIQTKNHFGPGDEGF